MSSLTTRTIKSGDKALLTVITLMEEKARRRAGLKAMHDLALEPRSVGTMGDNINIKTNGSGVKRLCDVYSRENNNYIS